MPYDHYAAEILDELRRPRGKRACWCDAGLDAPSSRDHTPACFQAILYTSRLRREIAEAAAHLVDA